MQRKERLKLTCPECGIEFERLQCQILNSRRKFCSNACIGKAKRNGARLFCEWCDTGFYRRRAEQDIGIKLRQFCSRECYSEWRADKRTSYPKGDGGRHRHRIVAESVLSRPLAPGEVVHHIDMNKQNCHPSNLAVFPSQSEHARCHFGKISDDELRWFSLNETALREKIAAGS